jgi:hypothetical protein
MRKRKTIDDGQLFTDAPPPQKKTDVYKKETPFLSLFLMEFRVLVGNGERERVTFYSPKDLHSARTAVTAAARR